MGANNYKSKAQSFGASGIWLMQEASGSLADDSGSGFTLTAVGAGSPTYQVAGPASGTFGIELPGGNAGFAYDSVSAAGDYVLPIGDYGPAGVGTNETAYTGVIWVRFDSITDTTNEILLRQNTSTNYTNFDLLKSNSDTLRHDEYLPSGLSLEVALATAGVEVGTWAQVAFTKDTGKREIWVNTTKVASDTSPETYSNNGTMKYFSVGCRYQGTTTDLGVDGAIAFASTYQSALTETQIGELYAAGANGDSAGGGGGATIRARRRGKGGSGGQGNGGGGRSRGRAIARWDRRRRRL